MSVGLRGDPQFTKRRKTIVIINYYLNRCDRTMSLSRCVSVKHSKSQTENLKTADCLSCIAIACVLAPAANVFVSHLRDRRIVFELKIDAFSGNVLLLIR